MRRREFIALVGATASFAVCGARAATRRMPVIGILDPDVTFIFDAFVQGMRDLGYVEGQNIAYVRKIAQGRPDAIPSLAAELVNLKADVIVTVAPAPVRAARQATTSIPIIFLALGDAVTAGIVSNLSRPGGNITGLSFLNDRAEREAPRTLARHAFQISGHVAVFYDPGSRAHVLGGHGASRTKPRSSTPRPTPLPSVDSYEPAFQKSAAAHVDAVDVLASPFFNANRERFAELATKYRLPAIYETGEYVRSGCLMAYGPVFTDMARRGATYADKILKGAKPGDLPVEQPTKFELAINLKAAKALGLVDPALDPRPRRRGDRVRRQVCFVI